MNLPAFHWGFFQEFLYVEYVNSCRGKILNT